MCLLFAILYLFFTIHKIVGGNVKKVHIIAHAKINLDTCQQDLSHFVGISRYCRPNLHPNRQRIMLLQFIETIMGL